MWSPDQVAVYNRYIMQHMQDVSALLPMMGTPMMGTPMMGTPMMGTPMMGTPMMGTPMMGIARPEELSSSDSDADDEELRTLFCANLDERVSEEILYEIFLQAGPIDSVNIPKEPSGKQRSFGFVTFVHQCAAPYAMQILQGLELFRKRVTIKFQGSDRIPSALQKRHSLPTPFKNSSMTDDSIGLHQTSQLSNLNPFAQSLDDLPRNDASFSNEQLGWARHFRGAKPYDRHVDNARRRSDSTVDRQRERDWDRSRPNHQHHNSGNRRSQQRYSGNRR